MKHLVKFTFGIAAAILLVAANASATVIADWTFESTFASITGAGQNMGPLTAESGVNAATAQASGHHNDPITTWSAPAGQGSLKAFSATSWQSGDYFQFKLDTTTYANINVDWDQTGSGTGPRDFIFQYSTDNSTYTQFGSAYTVLLNTSPPWGATSGTTKYHYSLDLSAVDFSASPSTTYFRLTANSGTAINGAGMGTGGTDRVDNFNVVSVPEPSTLVLLGFGLVSCVLAIRRRRS